MATALGFVVFGVGCSLIYIGYRGVPLTQFWGGLLGASASAGPTSDVNPATNPAASGPTKPGTSGAARAAGNTATSAVHLITGGF